MAYRKLSLDLTNKSNLSKERQFSLINRSHYPSLSKDKRIFNEKNDFKLLFPIKEINQKMKCVNLKNDPFSTVKYKSKLEEYQNNKEANHCISISPKTINRPENLKNITNKGKENLSNFCEKFVFISEVNKKLQKITKKHRFLYQDCCESLYFENVKQEAENDFFRHSFSFHSILLFSAINFGIERQETCEEEDFFGLLLFCMYESFSNHFLSFILTKTVHNDKCVTILLKSENLSLFLRKNTIVTKSFSTPIYRFSQDSTLLDQKEIYESDSFSSENFPPCNTSFERTMIKCQSMVKSSSNSFISSIIVPELGNRVVKGLKTNFSKEEECFHSQVDFLIDGIHMTMVKNGDISFENKSKWLRKNLIYFQKENDSWKWDSCNDLNSTKYAVASNYIVKERKIYFIFATSIVVYLSKTKSNFKTPRMISSSEEFFTAKDSSSGRLKVHFKKQIEEIPIVKSPSYYDTYDEMFSFNNQNVISSNPKFKHVNYAKTTSNEQYLKRLPSTITTEDSTIKYQNNEVYSTGKAYKYRCVGKKSSEKSAESVQLPNINKKRITLFETSNYFEFFSGTKSSTENEGSEILSDTFLDIPDIPSIGMEISNDQTEDEMSIDYLFKIEDSAKKGSDSVTSISKDSDKILSNQNGNEGHKYENLGNVIPKDLLVNMATYASSFDSVILSSKTSLNISFPIMVFDHYEKLTEADYKTSSECRNKVKNECQQHFPFRMNKTWFSSLKEKFNFNQKVLHFDPTLRNDIKTRTDLLLDALYFDYRPNVIISQRSSSQGFVKFFSDLPPVLSCKPISKEKRSIVCVKKHKRIISSVMGYSGKIDNKNEEIKEFPPYKKGLYNILYVLLTNLKLQKFSNAAIGYKVIKIKEIIRKLQNISIQYSYYYFDSINETLFKILEDSRFQEERKGSTESILNVKRMSKERILFQNQTSSKNSNQKILTDNELVLKIKDFINSELTVQGFLLDLSNTIFGKIDESKGRKYEVSIHPNIRISVERPGNYTGNIKTLTSSDEKLNEGNRHNHSEGQSMNDISAYENTGTIIHLGKSNANFNSKFSRRNTLLKRSFIYKKKSIKTNKYREEIKEIDYPVNSWFLESKNKFSRNMYRNNKIFRRNKTKNNNNKKRPKKNTEKPPPILSKLPTERDTLVGIPSLYGEYALPYVPKKSENNFSSPGSAIEIPQLDQKKESEPERLSVPSNSKPLKKIKMNCFCIKRQKQENNETDLPLKI